MRGERVEIAPTDAVLKGARVESVEWDHHQPSSPDGFLVITFSTGATLYADAPALYVDKGSYYHEISKAAVQMLIRETYLNATENHMIGESEPYEPFTEDTGELFRSCQSEYGRCIGKVYIDTDERTIPCGWVFQGRDKYEDSDETYLREVWVTLYDRYTRETIITAEPHALGRALVQMESDSPYTTWNVTGRDAAAGARSL